MGISLELKAQATEKGPRRSKNKGEAGEGKTWVR